MRRLPLPGDGAILTGMSWLYTIPGAIFAIAGLVFIHELGHMLVAKIFGIRVKVFSLGFGRRLWGFERGGTDYRVSAFPFGGYVRMAGADPFSESGSDWEEEDTPREQWFMSKPAWQRLLVMLGGPAANLVLPFVLYTGIMAIGEPQPRSDVGSIATGSPADTAGLQPQDHVIRVGDTPVSTWNDFTEALQTASGAAIPLRVERDGAEFDLSLPTAGVDPATGWTPEAFGFDRYAPSTLVLVDDKASPAAKAGLETGDLVTHVNGVEVRTWYELADVVAAATGPLELTLYRGDEEEPRSFTVAPSADWNPTPTPTDDAVWVRYGMADTAGFVAAVEPESPADRAGMKAGDRVLAVQGVPIRRFGDIVEVLARHTTGKGEEQSAAAVDIVVRRDGAVQTLSVRPETTRIVDDTGKWEWRPILGLQGLRGMQPVYIPRAYALPTAMVRAVDQTTDSARQIVERLGELLTQEAPVGENLGGPVRMFMTAQRYAEAGIMPLMQLISILSINLGVLNLVPIPILDGGQILLYAAEWLRGRPLPLVLRERAQQLGVIMVVLLIFAVTINDVYKAFTG